MPGPTLHSIVEILAGLYQLAMAAELVQIKIKYADLFTCNQYIILRTSWPKKQGNTAKM